MQQLTINYEAGLTEAYPTCREFVQARVHRQGRPQKAIAADMDYSPSHLSRKLAQSPNDSMRFNLDDLELFIATTGDTSPILYLVEKYLTEEDELTRMKRRVAELEEAAEQRRQRGAV